MTVPNHDLQICFKTRLKSSWNLQSKEGVYQLNVPECFRNDELSLDMLRQWARVCIKNGFRRKNINPKKRLLESQIRDRMQLQTPKLVHSKLKTLNPQGQFHNLDRALEFVNQKYFDNTLKVSISWSSRSGGLSFHTLRQNAAGEVVHYISISKGYDHPDCSLNALHGIVYHECLHVAHPVQKGRGGRRIIHSRAFREDEKKYEHYEEWMRWHRTQLPRIIYKMKTKAYQQRPKNFLQRLFKI